MSRLDGRTPPQRPDEVPAGHAVSAHAVFGWCAAEPGKLLADEVVAWRSFAGALAGRLAGGPPAVPIPRAVSAVEGCTCSGGGEHHAARCAVWELPAEVFVARVAAAKDRTGAFAAGVQALWETIGAAGYPASSGSSAK
jgi:hypothetical protein